MRGSGHGSALGRDCRPSPKEGRVGSPWGVLRGRRAAGTSCATLRSARHSGGQKEELCPTKRSLFSCAPQGHLLWEEATASRGRQRRVSPDPCRGEDRVWAFTLPPPPQVPVLGQKPGATELIARQCCFQRWLSVFSHAVPHAPGGKKKRIYNKTTAHRPSGLTLGPAGSA